MKNQNTPFGAKLNLRGSVRQSGVKLTKYLKTSGKQNIVIVFATIALFVIFYLDEFLYVCLLQVTNRKQ